MYKILLADNEGVVLDSLRHIIFDRYGESCDIRTAKTALHARTLARKFIPDIAVINIQMPGMHSFEVVREIRSYHLKCVFITVSSYRRSVFYTEAKNLNVLSHLTKPLFREKILPVLDHAMSIVSHQQKRSEESQLIQEKLDAIIPILEHGMISQMFFPENVSSNLAQYQELLNIPQPYGRVVTLTFGEGATENRSGSKQPAIQKEGALQNLIGSAVRLQKEYKKFRTIVLETFPLAIVGPVMGNHILFLLPYWREETIKDQHDFETSLNRLLEILEESFEGFCFYAVFSPVKLLTELHL